MKLLIKLSIILLLTYHVQTGKVEFENGSITFQIIKGKIGTIDIRCANKLTSISITSNYEFLIRNIQSGSGGLALIFVDINVRTKHCIFKLVHHHNADVLYLEVLLSHLIFPSGAVIGNIRTISSNNRKVETFTKHLNGPGYELSWSEDDHQDLVLINDGKFSLTYDIEDLKLQEIEDGNLKVSVAAMENSNSFFIVEKNSTFYKRLRPDIDNTVIQPSLVNQIDDPQSNSATNVPQNNRRLKKKKKLLKY
jgi:hypothetical protein